MQPADEGPCAPKMCRQQRGPCAASAAAKSFQGKRFEGRSRFDRSAVVEVPLLGDGHHFTFHPEQPHHFQPHQQQQHQHQRLQQLHQSSVTISSSSQQHHPASQQQQQQRFPCENRPSSRVPTSTSAPAANVAAAAAASAASPGVQQQQRRAGSGRAAEPRFSPDCTYGISSGGRLKLEQSE